MRAGRHDASKFELHHDDVHERRDRGTPRVDHIVSGLAIEGIARVVQLAQPAQRIGHLQQRTLDVVAQAPEQVLGRGSQVDHVEMAAQLLAVGLAQHRAAPGGQHAVRAGRQLGDHLLLEVAEGGFTFALEVIADRAADALLDLVVGVDEGKIEPKPQPPAHRGLSGAGQSDECDGHAVAATPARQRAALRSVIIFGVIKTSISVLFAMRVRVRNSAPT